MVQLLKHKDVVLGTLYLQGRNFYLTQAVLFPEAEAYFPLPFQKIVQNKDKCLKAKSTDQAWLLTEAGRDVVSEWLSDREIPLDRTNLEKYVESGQDRRAWMVNNNAFSFTDCYWLTDDQKDMPYSELQERFSDVTTFETGFWKSPMYAKENCTLGGSLEKFWFRDEDGKLLLSKKNAPLFDVLSVREVLAADIYSQQGISHVPYDSVRNHEDKIVGCVCPAFTSPSLEFVPVADLLATEDKPITGGDVYERIPLLAEKYGANRQEVSDFLDAQTIVDYLITNRDRHLGNFGFLRDPDTLRFVSPAPIFDSGSSERMEGVSPENAKTTTVHGLYPTEGEMLSHVKNWGVIRVDLLPTAEEVRSYYQHCDAMTPWRLDTLTDLYQQKVEIVRAKQKEWQQEEMTRK